MLFPGALPLKRTTILLPDDLAARIELERRRRDVSATTVVREALTAYFAQHEDRSKKLRFVGIGQSAHPDTAERAEEILAEEWADAITPGWHTRP